MLEQKKVPENETPQTPGRRIRIPEEPKHLMQQLLDAGYEAFAVGGCVRDSLLGRTPHDWDICTNALPEQTKAVFSDFRVLDTGLKHGTLTVLLEAPYEITTYRRDGEYSDHRHPDRVEFVRDLTADLSRRDFTINAMAADIRGEITDPFGGQQDLLLRRILCVGEPERRFTEDALRILRAMRFAARFGFAIEANTARAMLAKKELLQKIAAERIGSEFLQILSGSCADLLLHYSAIFAVFIPEISPCIGFAQNNPHHCHDVWTHTVETVRSCRGGTPVKAACLYHDLGKPLCYSEDASGAGRFYGHAAVSAKIAESSLRTLRLPAKFIAEVVQLVASHDWVLAPERPLVRRCLHRLGEAQFENLVLLRAADRAAQRLDAAQRQALEAETEQLLQLAREIQQQDDCFQLKDLALRGGDLLQLGFPAGKTLGSALQCLLELVIDGKLENQREALLEKARELLSKAELPGTKGKQK